MADPCDDPRAQVQTLVQEARRDFAADVDAILYELRQVSDAFGETLGEVSRVEALRALRTLVLQKFDERLPLRGRHDPLGLQQLVREAYDVFAHPDASTVDLRDWMRAAEPFVRDR